MKKIFSTISLGIALSATLLAQTKKDASLSLWYEQPAANWNEALPIGNGFLAAMIFGGVEQDKIQLNEETIWAGEPGNNILPDVYKPITEIRQLLFSKKYEAAQQLANEKFPRKPPEGANYGMQYQTAGNLLIDFAGKSPVSQYRRELNIAQATSAVMYEQDGITFKREYIAAIPGRIIAIRLTANKPGAITCDLSLDAPYEHYDTEAKDGKVILSATTSSVDGKRGKVKFSTQFMPRAEGGAISSRGKKLHIDKADAVTIYVSIATNVVNYHDVSARETHKADSLLQAAMKMDFSKLKEEHIKAYTHYFDRVNFQLGGGNHSNMPTDKRLAAFAAGKDPGLVALYFQFGRYLLICSSYPGSQPANLQGKWNDLLTPPWDSKYTVNINTEMNYWPAEVTALPEMHGPLFDMLEDLAVTGRESAEKMYHARGWNVHHNTDLWRISGPVDGGFYGMWPMGGAWLSQHIWQHYLYTGDIEFLKKMYPVLKGAALFYTDVLQEEPGHHWMVVAPSMSPENTYQKNVGISAGTTMDNQLVFDVLNNAIRSASILNTDLAFSDTLKQLVSRLPPMQVGHFGQLQEWIEDWDREDDHHRHVSHLYGLFPSNQVSPYTHPELFEACANTLAARGDKSTGWSMGWKVNLWARLLDGNRAYKLIADQLTPAPTEQKEQNGGTYPNLLDAHPPFQIDGNFGCTSGIAEMLLQSHDGAIDILPALPDAWRSGQVEGLVARGGFVIDASWKQGRLTYLKIHSTLGGNCRLRLHSSVTADKNVYPKAAKGVNPNPFYATNEIKAPLIHTSKPMKGIDIDKGKLYDIRTEAGKDYIFRAKK